MKKSLIIFLVLFLLICGCNKTNESDNLVEHPIINTKENILSGKLVISVPMYWGSIVNIVHQFKELHPNVEFEIRSSNKEGEYFTDIRTFDDYVIQMATDVMSAMLIYMKPVIFHTTSTQKAMRLKIYLNT